MTDAGLIILAIGIWWAGQSIGAGIEEIADAIRETFAEPSDHPAPPTPKEKA
jgi:hypothetical protein